MNALKRQKKRKYSALEKSAFHESRIKNDCVSENKRFYSRNWIEGFTDPHYRSNLDACNFEIKKRRKAKIKVNSYDIGLYGYRNGLLTRKKVVDGK